MDQFNNAWLSWGGVYIEMKRKVIGYLDRFVDLFAMGEIEMEKSRQVTLVNELVEKVNDRLNGRKYRRVYQKKKKNKHEKNEWGKHVID